MIRSWCPYRGPSLLCRSKRLITYDTPAIAAQKAQYINERGLGGAMWWELDADKPEVSGEALVPLVRSHFGQLEWRENELDYPGSSEFPKADGHAYPAIEYDNLRNHMH
jgi:GH18 family chitinase